MAGANAITGFVSLTEAESFAVEYWPLELYKLSLAPPPGELQGKVALVTGAAGGIGRAVIVDARGAAGACVVGFDIDADGASEAVAALGDRRAIAVAGDVTYEAAFEERSRVAVEAFGGVDIVVSNAGVASSAPHRGRPLAEWDRNPGVLTTGYFLVAREAFRVLRSRARRLDRLRRLEELARRGPTTRRTRPRRRPSCTSPAVSPRRAAGRIRVNTVNPDAVLQGSRIWDSSWRAERAGAYGIAPEELEEHYRSARHLASTCCPRTSPRRCCISPPQRDRARAPATC